MNQDRTRDDRTTAGSTTGPTTVRMTRRAVTAALATTPFCSTPSWSDTNPADPSFLDGTALNKAYAARSLSPVDVVDATFKRIDAIQPVVNAFVLTDKASAMRAAEASAARWRDNTPIGPLDGVPVTVKDNIPWAGHPIRRGSRTGSDKPIAESGPAVERLERAGAIVLGKTTLPEFGWKGLGDSPLSGLIRNPWNNRLTTGGSSAGGAACAALNIGAVHLGTDGAGSLRIPSSFCGVFGMKPSFGRVPAYPAGTTLHLGPLSRNVHDAAALIQSLAGSDPRDITSIEAPVPDLLGQLETGIRGLRVAWSPRLGYVERLDAEVEDITAKAAAAFADLGAHVDRADPGFPDPMPILQPLWLGGAWTTLRSIPESRWSEVDPGLLALAMKGKSLNVADFATALSARVPLHVTLARFFEKFDLLLTPTVATAAFEAGHNTPPSGEFGDDWLNWAPYTYPFNLSFNPAATIPCGFTRDGRPVGLQVVGPYLREDVVLRAARAFEIARPWPYIDTPKPA